MSKFAALFTLLVAVLAGGLFAAPAQAQRDRVFVASYGSDTNPCTFGSPCKTFQHAHDAVAPSGEITAIDSAGFGPIIINKAVTVTSPDGVEAGIATAAGQTAITITAGASDDVILHGLTIDGANAAENGIVFGSGNSLIVSNCTIRRFVFAGFVLNAAASTTELTDSMIAYNKMYGVLDAPTGNQGTTFTFNRVRLFGNATGMSLDDSNTSAENPIAIQANGSESVAAGNTIGFGTTGSNQKSNYVSLELDHINAENNGTGIKSTGTSRIWLSRSKLGDNGTGYDAANGVVISFGNNQISDATNTGHLAETQTLQ